MKHMNRFINYFFGNRPKASNTIGTTSIVSYLLHKMFMHPEESLCFTIHEAAFILIGLYIILQMNLNLKQPEG